MFKTKHYTLFLIAHQHRVDFNILTNFDLQSPLKEKWWKNRHFTFSDTEAKPLVGCCVLMSKTWNFPSSEVATSLFMLMSFLSNSTEQTCSRMQGTKVRQAGQIHYEAKPSWLLCHQEVAEFILHINSDHPVLSTVLRQRSSFSDSKSSLPHTVILLFRNNHFEF